MQYEVRLSEEAEGDIEDIYRYIVAHDGIANAERVLLALEESCRSLASLPARGNVPKELRSLGITDYREIHRKPCRIIYRVFGASVVVYCVVDGRRDMQSFLERRMLR